MKLTVSCQLCGLTLVVVENTNFTSDDINNYENSCYCTTVQSDGVTQDGNSAIIVSKTAN